jgi:magnesium transporter
MVMATGGMVGTQASSLVIRALTVGDFTPRAFPLVLWKEARVSAGLALLLSSIALGETFVLGTAARHADLLLFAGLATAIAMATHVVSAALLGASVPLIAHALRRDPAMVSTPAVTAIADFSGVVIYVVVAHAMLT